MAKSRNPWPERIIFVLCLLPVAFLAWKWQNNDLGVNQVEYVSRYSGKWTLRMLLLTLAITPLRHIPGLNGLIRFRRMLGLFTFLFGCLHGYHYLAREVQWYWEIVVEDLTLRRFFILGAVALVLMAPLALTSFDAAVRWMGGKRWRLLHRLVYVSAIAAAWHYLLQAKGVDLLPLTYAGLVAVLLLARVGLWMAKRRKLSHAGARNVAEGRAGVIE